MAALVTLLRSYMRPQMEELLKELYGASFVDCADRCLTITATPVSTAFSLERRIWVQVLYQVNSTQWIQEL